MPDPRLESALVTACSMEVPLEDFGHLPRELGCSLRRTDHSLTLIADQPGCALHFRVDGLQARLATVDIGHDPEGRFFRDVLGLILQLYSGDLEAQLIWSPRGAMEERVYVRAGETTHPLLFQAEPLLVQAAPESLQQAERWLAEAKEAWVQYLSLKARSEA